MPVRLAFSGWRLRHAGRGAVGLVRDGELAGLGIDRAAQAQGADVAPAPMNASVVLVMTGTLAATPTLSVPEPERLPERRSSTVDSDAATRMLPPAWTLVEPAVGFKGSSPIKARVVIFRT